MFFFGSPDTTSICIAATRTVCPALSFEVSISTAPFFSQMQQITRL
jgi:hypothetical protein